MEDLKKFIKKLIEESKKENIITNLQEINERFLICYQIQIKDLTIIPIETEIYYWNNDSQKNFFVDKMIYKNKLQKDNFGKLYFHRIKYKEDMKWQWEGIEFPIDLKRGGVDICLSDTDDYYLSILIRTALIDKKENFISGINNICKEIIKFYKPKGCWQCFLAKLENIEELVIKKRDNKQFYIDTTNIFKQKRISGDDYSKINMEELNCLNLGEYLPNEDKQKDNYYFLKLIKKQSFYTEKRKKEIIKKYKDSLQTKIY